MDQRLQKQKKTLQNKLVNMESDILNLEKEINLPTLANEKDILTEKYIIYNNITREAEEIKQKISENIGKIKEYELEKLDICFEKNKTLNDEQEIYKNEMTRIEFALSEWRMYMTNKLEALENTKKELTVLLNELVEEQRNLSATINNYNTVKRDLRLQNMNKLLEQQMVYKTEKSQYCTHAKTLADLLLEKSNIERKINSYTDDRYKINKDYYDWKHEITVIDGEINEMLAKMIIDENGNIVFNTNASDETEYKNLQERKGILQKDSRQDYTMRYIQLDNDLVRNQNMLRRINKQLMKLQCERKDRPVLKINKNVDEHTILKEYQCAKHECCCLQKEIDTQSTMINTIQTEIDKIQLQLSTYQKPDDIVEFEKRALQRLEIMNKRIMDKYNKCITDVEKNICECRQQIDIYNKKYESIMVTKEQYTNIELLNTAMSDINTKLDRKLLLDKLKEDKRALIDTINKL